MGSRFRYELQGLLLHLTHIRRSWRRGNTGKTARRVGVSPLTNQPQKKKSNGSHIKRMRWALFGYNIMGVTRWHCLHMSRFRRPWWGRILQFLCCDEESENECRAIFVT